MHEPDLTDYIVSETSSLDHEIQAVLQTILIEFKTHLFRTFLGKSLTFTTFQHIAERIDDLVESMIDIDHVDLTVFDMVPDPDHAKTNRCHMRTPVSLNRDSSIHFVITFDVGMHGIHIGYERT